MLDDTRTHLKLVAATGYSPACLRAWHEFPLELATPISDAVRERRTVVVGSLGEIHARYPHLRCRTSGRTP